MSLSYLVVVTLGGMLVKYTSDGEEQDQEQSLLMVSGANIVSVVKSPQV